MEKRVKEAVRYLGFGKNAADERTLTLIRSCFTELEHTAGPRSICRIFEMERTEEGKIAVGKLEIESRSLSRNLQDRPVRRDSGRGDRPADHKGFADGYGEGSRAAGVRGGISGRILR